MLENAAICINLYGEFSRHVMMDNSGQSHRLTLRTKISSLVENWDFSGVLKLYDNLNVKIFYRFINRQALCKLIFGRQVENEAITDDQNLWLIHIEETTVILYELLIVSRGSHRLYLDIYLFYFTHGRTSELVE